MKQKRLTRDESRQLTRARLVEAAERIFVRAGFEAASVEDISAEAGFSRGAFYSNFESKDAIFLELLDRRRLEIQAALDAIFREKHDAGERFLAVRDWYASQWQERRWIILRMEFHLRGMRSPEIRKPLGRLLEQELRAYSALIAQYLSEAGLPPEESPQSIARALLGVSLGLGALSLLSRGAAGEHGIVESHNLAFNRLIAHGRGTLKGSKA